MRIQIVVQHHPRRAALLPPLLAQLPENTLVVDDPGANDPQRSPWRCYKHCLQVLALERFKTTTHLCVVQDDALLCRDFAQALERVVAARPDDPLCLFVPGVGLNRRRIMDACDRDERWAELDTSAGKSWVPVVCVVWPRAKAEALLAFFEQAPPERGRTADDANVGAWARETRTRVLATVPSLVEHPDAERSLVGTANFSGLAPHRIAACWLGPAASALDFAW